jgi:hypothetical protein
VSCPECGGAHEHDLQFDHDQSCRLGQADRQRAQTDLERYGDNVSFTRGLTNEEELLATPFGVLGVAAPYSVVGGPVPVSERRKISVEIVDSVRRRLRVSDRDLTVYDHHEVK